MDVGEETLELNARTGSWVCGGVVLGGSVVFRDGAGLTTATSSWGCVLDGVTFNSDVDWSPENTYVYVRRGLTVNGTLRLGNASGSTRGQLIFQGNSPVNVTGGVVFGGTNSSMNNGFILDGGTLTIAADTLLRGGNFGLVAQGTLINYGTILADTANGSFTITSTSGNFRNEGTLKAENGGSMALVGTWVTNQPLQFSGPGRLTLNGTWNYSYPLTMTSGTLTLAGNWRLSEPLVVRGASANLSSTTGAWGTSSLTTVNSSLFLGDGLHPADVQLNLTNTTVYLVGRLNNIGRELLLNAATGSWNLRGGQIIGGTVRTIDGTRLNILAASPFSLLDGITLEGEMDMPHLYTQVYILNGLTLNGTFFAGTVLNPGPAQVLFEGSQTVTSTRTGTIILRGSLETWDEPGRTLTFGPQITVRGEGRIYARNSTVINQATIHADRPNGFISIEAPNWSSSGPMRATNGGRLDLRGGFTLTAPLTVENGGELFLTGHWISQSTITAVGSPVRLEGRWINESTITAVGSQVWLGDRDPWSNRGTIRVENCTVVMRGAVTTDDLGTIARTGGTVEFAGALDNTGRTLTLNEGTGSWFLSGSILRGTVTTNNVALMPTGGQAWLSGVVFNGLLDASVANNTRLQVFSNLVLNGTLLLGDDTGVRTASLECSSTQTISTLTGGTIIFGGGTNNRISVSGPRLTFGTGIVVRGRNGTIHAGTGTLLNEGTIQADEPGSTLTLSGATWSITGAIVARNGGQVLARGATMSFTNASTLTVEAARFFTDSAAFTNSGTITVNLGSTLLLAGGTHTLNGSLTGAGTVEFSDCSSTVAGTYNVGATSLTGGSVIFTLTGALSGSFTHSGGTVHIPVTGGLSVLADYTQTAGTTAITSGYLYVLGTLAVQSGALEISNGGLAYGSRAVTLADITRIQDFGFLFSDGVLTQSAGFLLTTNGVFYGTAFQLLGGTLFGSGYVFANLTNAGRIQVGGAGAAGYLYLFGEYTQTGTGILDLELSGLNAGVDSDFFYVDGTATLAAALNLTLLSTYRPNPDDYFVFFWSNGGVTGDFTTINGLDLGSGLYLYPFTDGFGYYLYAYLS